MAAGRKTRSKGAPKTAAEAVEEATASTTPKSQLGPESANPPKVFVLPKDISSSARIVLLSNPRTSVKSRYLHCPANGFYEFTKIAAPKTTPRSWLIEPQKLEVQKEDLTEEKALALSKPQDDISAGYITRSADLFVVTPVDPLFLILPVLSPSTDKTSSEPSKRLFLASDDYFDKITESEAHFRYLMAVESTRGLIEKRMAVVCDTVEAGDELMYRFSEKKLLYELLQKATRMVEKGLPASMEEKLVKRPLEAPMPSLQQGESSALEIEEEDSTVPDSSTPVTQSTDSQTSLASTTTIISEASTAATSISESSQPALFTESKVQNTTPEGVPRLLRLRTAIFFLLSNYVAPHLADVIKKLLASPESPIDFAPLDTHLAHLAELRQNALASRSKADFSSKRPFEDDEAAEERAEKKRKKEEDEKRKKAGESRGVRDLKKVNVSGMKKMSDFFKKKT